MSYLEAIILGVIQGLTEFLPISSSGHLMIGEHLLGFSEPNLLFTVVVHFGTLLAVVLFYKKDVWAAISGIFEALKQGLRSRSVAALEASEGARLALLLGLGTIPTVIIGLGLRPYLSSGFGDFNLVAVISATFIINGFILWSARFADEDKMSARQGRWTLWNITPAVAMLIGVAQGLAVVPGFSRSGLTIAAALWLSVYRVESARFSFLLSIPTIAGAMLLETLSGLDEAGTATLSGVDVAVYGVAAALAAILGYLSIIVLVKMLRRAQFWHFAWYCWGTGALGLAYVFWWA